MGVWLELRIHGVHNTPPQSMLGVPASSVGQVAGDGITGIYRTRDGKVPLRTLTVPASAAIPAPTPVAVEAYSWGGLTSNVKGVVNWLTRVLWMVLLPFALMNLAYWARPELDVRQQRTGADPGDRRVAHGLVRKYEKTLAYDLSVPERHEQDPRPLVRTAVVASRIVRIAAAGMTILLVLVPLTIGVDLLAWQCYREGAAGCPALPGPFDFFSSDYFVSSPQRRLAVGAVPALLVILLLWQVSRQSLARYEAVTRTPVDDGYEGFGRTDTNGPVLQDPTLWSGTGRTQRLRRLHITLALCTVVTYTSIPVLAGNYADQDGKVQSLLEHGSGWLWVDGAFAVVAALALLTVAFVLLPRVRPGDLESSEQPQTEDQFVRQRRINLWLVSGAVVLTVGHLVALLIGPGSLTLRVDQAALRGENVWFVGLFLLFAAAAVSLSMTGRFTSGAAIAGGFVAAALLLGSSYWLWEQRDVAPLQMSVICVVVSVGLGVVLARRRRTRAYGKDPSQLAWRGAGPTVLAVAAVWIGLLFTTAATTYAANFLNGDQSVADLGTSAEKVPAAPGIPTASGDSDDDVPVFVATGDVTVHDGRIEVTYVEDASGAVVSQTVRVVGGSLSLGSYAASEDRNGVLLGRTEVKQARLVLPEDASRLVYERSCIVRKDVEAGGAGCKLANGDGRDGRLPAPDVLEIGRPDGSSTIALHPTDVPQATLLLPQVLVWAPLGQLVLVLFVVGIAGYVTARLKKLHRESVRTSVERDPRIAEDDRKACTEARVRALFPHRAELCVGWLGSVTAIVSFAVIVLAETGRAPWVLFGGVESQMRLLSALALWVALGSALVVVWVASKMRSSGETARGVGIVWDLTTFWPRAAHPLAPLCYAERVVPEMVTRIRWALHEAEPERAWGGAGGVIVSAHSQGSTIAVAALSRLGDADLGKVRLVTYGSQLRTWYGRIFPGVFGPEALGNEPTKGPTSLADQAPDVAVDDDPLPALPAARPPTGAPLDRIKPLRERLEPAGTQEPRWVNLFRRTDPIGFRVFTDGSTDHDVPVLEIPTRRHGDPGPKVMGHSGYQHTPEYVAVVGRWTGEAPVALAVPPVVNPPMLPEP